MKDSWRATVVALVPPFHLADIMKEEHASQTMEYVP